MGSDFAAHQLQLDQVKQAREVERLGALDQLSRSVLRSSIEVNKYQGRLADTIKAQKCQCIERRGSTAILVKDAGASVENRRHIY